MNVKRAFVFLLALAALAGPTRGARGADEAQVSTLTTGDGAKLSARFYPGDQGAKSPAVIVLDDLGSDARPAVCDDLARQLVKEGCTVICFDFRGSGRSRGVEPEFWEDANNRQMVRGYKADEPPESIAFADFKPGYLPTLANDVAAARAYMERRNDGRECNIAQTYLIGFGRGATVGQLWLAAEWSRYRVSGARNKLALNPEGRDVMGCVWIGPRFDLDRAIPMFDLLKRAEAKKSTLVGLVHDSGDAEGSRFAKQCQEAFNAKGKAPLVVTHTVAEGTRATAARGEVVQTIGKFLAGMRKLQEVPLWDDRNFGDRRFIWVLGGATVPAKDEGDTYFQPVPVGRLLGK